MSTTRPADLYELLKPFENYRSDKARTFNGPNVYVDLAHGVTNAIGADIRNVTPEGVKVFFYRGCELVPFDAIRRVTVRTADLRENLSSRVLFDAALAGECVA